MERFATLEPVKLHSAVSIPPTSTTKSLQPGLTFHPHPQRFQPFIGKLPSDLHLLVLSHLPLPDVPAYARVCRATNKLIKEDSKDGIWIKRWKALGVDRDNHFKKVLDQLEKIQSDHEKREKERLDSQKQRAQAPPAALVEDDFGDFATAAASDALGQPAEMGDFLGAFGSAPKSLSIVYAPTTPSGYSAKESTLAKYRRAHNLLRPLLRFLTAAPHVVLSDLAEYLGNPSLFQQAKLLRLLSFFLSPAIKPVRAWNSLYLQLRTAMDRYDSNLLAAFDVADGKGDEQAMRAAADSSWQVWDGAGDGWEMGKVWAEKREIFYQVGNWRALDNFTEESQLDFRAMDEFMDVIIGAINEHGARAVRVFPPKSRVVLLFLERLANELVGDYISTLLTHARELSPDIYLKSAAASFKEAWRMVDVIMQVSKEREGDEVTKTMVEDIVYQMFEPNMDEYLDEEVETVKMAFDRICRGWDQDTSGQGPASPAHNTTRFLTAQNPALVKRNVLANFTNLLLLPVTIVPKTVGAVGGALGGALMTGGSAAVQGIAMLNPQRWGGSAGGGGGHGDGYSSNLNGNNAMLFEVEEEDEYERPEGALGSKTGNKLLSHLDITSPTPLVNNRDIHSPANGSGLSPLPPNSAAPTHQLDLLLSLDVALELIHADRESLKRVETFAGYPGHYGHRVRDTIEEIFILLLQTMGERHVYRGFSQATDRMRDYKPSEHAETSNVAPLVQFFELVHIGDTIQSMVQVYFDKELAPHIDKTDFLNAVVREKKRFENTLDDSVAHGLNAGTEVLMNQVEHIILTRTKAREYYPPEDAPLELGPTKGCTEAIDCLETHCKLLRGSTSKEVLEVFYQEVGLRLIGILQKHIKRQIISLSGGFQVIADLNSYNMFVASLKIPTITADFSNLKMLGHVYVVEDAKDLAQIVRDVTRYGGAYRPEDIYEFIQRRSDWKKIEKIVDKTMYNLSFKEDCVVC